MKTKILLLLLGAAAASAHAQCSSFVVTYGGAPACETRAACLPPTTWAAPVAVCRPPLVRVVPVTAACAPDVIYFGGPNARVRNYFPGCHSGYGYSAGRGANATVIYFGGGQACQQGYRFRHAR